ncbi:DUF6069 family protein [Spirosoma areae]
MKTNQLNWWQAIVLAAGTGATLNALLYAIGRATGVLHDGVQVGTPPQTLTLVPVLISSVVPVLVAAGVFALLNRFSKQPLRVFTILAVVLLALSFANPFLAIPNVSVATALWLNLMHIVVAGSVLYFFRRQVSSQSAVLTH